MAWLLQLEYHQTVEIYQTVRIAGGDGGRARGPRDLMDDWGLPVVVLHWGGCCVLDRRTAASDVAGVVAAVAKTVVLAVANSDHSHTLLVPVPVQPGNVRAAS